MFHAPAVNLFLYNALLSHVLTHVTRCIDAEKKQYQPGFWSFLPVLGEFLEEKKRHAAYSLEYEEFPKVMLNCNYFINALVLLPGFVQVTLKTHRLLSVLVAIVVIWNLFVFERILAFQLTLMWSLWAMDSSSWNYVGAIGIISFMNIFHLILIIDSIKMQHNCLRTALQIELAQQLVEGDDNQQAEEELHQPVDGAGDGPSH